MTAAEEEKRRALQRLKRDFFLPPLLENKYAIQKIIGEVSLSGNFVLFLLLNLLRARGLDLDKDKYLE